MSKFAAVWSAVLLLSAAAALNAQADRRGRPLVVVMTNDHDANQIKVYDAETRALVQTLSTQGKGGAGGNARGVKQYDGVLVAAVNNGSNTVALFRRDHDRLRFEQLVGTTSQPVSVDFSDDHMYVAGATTVDSFAIRNGRLEGFDGTAGLILADGGFPPEGSTAQVGVVSDDQLLVTLKADPDPGTVDVIALTDGRITGAVPTAVSAPDGTLTPFGFSVYPDGTAIITLAHSNQDALFRNGTFAEVVDAGQAADCWTTRVGKYVFTTNTASRTLSRLIGTGSHVFVDSEIAATISTGSPTDLDAAQGLMAVVDHAAGHSHLSFFSYNEFGELSASGGVIDIGVPDANGVAVIPPDQEEE
jgi:hypothetical protein